MLSKLTTKHVRTIRDVKTFFDQSAQGFSEQHGNPERLLNYRINLIKKCAHFQRNDVVLDIGCGIGHHLIALAGEIGRGIGIDLSEVMVDVATERLVASDWNDKITFCVDNGEKLSTILDESVDVALCVGSLEHMLDQPTVLRNAYRVLKPNGRFVCLTPNGGYVWYRFLAPVLGIDTKHLSTDRLLSEREFRELLTYTGFRTIKVTYWTFIPKGDMHPLMGLSLQMFDWFGRLFRINNLRGGLVFLAKLNRNYD